MQHLQPNTTLQGGKYRIERVLGQGGFGITYLATQTCGNKNFQPPMLPYFEKQVAIKELFIGGSGQAINDRRGNMVVVTNTANQQSFNQQREKFKKEALRLSNLNHPNLVKVHEFFEENGTAYYVMDYIDGESLRTKLNREGVLSESLVLKYLQQLLPALEIAHKQSIWHLDIKPENIMVDRHDHAYLIDFGASKHVKPNSTLTTSLALAYTPGYCPPEILDLSNETPEYYLQAIKDIGPWTDIYALGATMYNLLTDNIPPSKRRLDKEGRNAFMFSNSISSSTKDMVIWMMKPNREERPQKIQEIAVKFSSANEDSVETILDESKSFFIEDNLYFIDEHNIKAVDLGLSIMWANSNIGGTLENPKGELCEWRDTNDIIRHRLGSNWKLPKQKDWEELVSKCKWTNVLYVNFDKQLDIEGFQITGPNGNSIFLPKTGEREKSGIVYCYGCYWTSGKDDELNPYYFCYDDEDETSQFVTVNPCDYLRLAVRPVCNVCSSPDMNGCNIQLDYDIIDSNLLDNLCRKYNHQSHTEQEVFVEDISKETNNSIGIVLIHLGWLMKEGKVNDSWNLYINNTRINVELVGFSAGDVFQVLASASYPISIDNIIEENSKQNKFAENPLLGEGSMEATLLGLGWLMKEGKLLFENNLISLS